MLPERPWAHECLVDKPSRQQGRRQSSYRAEIKTKRWKAILAVRHETVVQFNLSGSQVRRDAPCSAIYRDQRVGFLGPRGQDTARAMIFERSPDQTDVVCQQSG